MTLSFTRKIAALLLVLAFCGGAFAPLSASAQFGGIQNDYGDDVQENFEKGVVACAGTAAIIILVSFIAGNLNVTTTDVPKLIKDYILDCVFWAFKNALIQMITGETVQWVQSGMGGNPAFVTNIRTYLRTVADYAAGAYIQKTVPFICSPFRAQLQLQLVSLYKNNRGDGYYDRLCTLTGSVRNVDRFLSGDFSSGGWDGWFALFDNSYNNPYGAYLSATDELALRITSQQQGADKKITLGQGFLSKEVQDCYSYPEGAGPPEKFTVNAGEDVTAARIRAGVSPGTLECDEPRIVTPGTTVKNSLESAIGVNLDQIASADEFDEIITLAAVYMISKILNGEKGLAGYNPSDFTYTVPDVTLPDLPGGGNDTTPGDSEPAGPPGAPVCFEKNGTFLVPERGGTVSAGFALTPPQGTSYDRIVVDIDVTNNGWPADRESWPAEIFWMGRPNNKNMFGYVKVNAPPSSQFMLRHGIGQSHVYKPKVTGKLAWPEGATYHFRYVYDVKDMRITIAAIDTATGDVVRTLSSVPDVPGINVGNTKFNIGFGYTETEANPKERPMYGWEYSNFKASFISSLGTPGNCTTSGSWNGSQGNPPNDDGSGGGGGGGDDDEGPDNPAY